MSRCGVFVSVGAGDPSSVRPPFRAGIGPFADEANSRNRLNVISFADACFRSFPADLIRAIRYTVRPSRGRFRNPLFLEKLEER